MSFIYGGTACNMSSYISLSSNNSASAGSATLCNNDINNYGFVTRFTATGMSNNGLLDYSFDKFRLSFNSLSNSTYLFYSSNMLTFSTTNFSPSNLVCVKYSASSNNTIVKAYINDVTSLSFSTGNTYSLSNGVHSWVSSNSTATEKRLYNPLVQNVMTVTNCMDIQQSLRVSGKLTCQNMAVSNLTVNSLSVVQATSNLTATTITTTGAIYSSNSVSSPYLTATSRLYTPSLEWTGGPMTFFSSNYILSTNSAVNALNITNAGNVGIGTTAPASLLDTAGVVTAWGLQLHSSAIVNFGYDVSKQTDAGRIGYQTYTSGCLDVVGAGTAVPRSVRIFDRMGIGMSPTGLSHALQVSGNTYMAGSLQQTSARNFGVTYSTGGSDSTHSTYTLPNSFSLCSYFSFYSTACSTIGSDFSGFNTSTVFYAPAAGVYQWNLYIASSPLTWWVNGENMFVGVPMSGTATLTSGQQFGPYTSTYTSGSPPSSVTVGKYSYFSITLIKENY